MSAQLRTCRVHVDASLIRPQNSAPLWRRAEVEACCRSLAGAQPKVIQEIGGWSSIDIVMNRYGHLFDTLQDDLAARQEEAYRAGGAWDDLLDIVARREIPMNPSPSDQVFVSADCLHETERVARTCCGEPDTKRRGWDV
jgi:hypothetical protein